MANDVFVHVGLPTPNIGAVRIEYEILGQDALTETSFDVYYQNVRDAELFQEMGRDRALRRGGTISHYWLTDLELPFTAQAMTAAELSIDAASQADITRGEIRKVIARLLKERGKITQEAIAGLADVLQGWVSKFFAELSGWWVWRQIITSFINSFTGTRNNLDLALELLNDDERWIAQECLSEIVTAFEDDPQGVAESVAVTEIGYGAEGWARILAARLLGMMAIVCPRGVRGRSPVP